MCFLIAFIQPLWSDYAKGAGEITRIYYRSVSNLNTVLMEDTDKTRQVSEEK